VRERGSVQHRTWAIVIQHQILLTEHHTLNPGDQLVTRRALLTVASLGAFDQYRLRITQRLTECHEIMHAQGATGPHHVGDGVGHPELHGDLHGSVQPDDCCVNTFGGQIFSHQIRVGGGDALSGQIGRRPIMAGGARVAETGRPETQRQPFPHGRIGVEHQVASGDAEIEFSRTDVDGNVLGPQKEKLDIVDRVDDGQVFRVRATPVAGLREDLGGGLAQRALVGNRDAQHVHSFR